MATRSRIVTFCVSFLLWMLLSFTFDWQHFTVGIIVSFLVASTMGDMFTDYAYKWFNLHRYFWFIIFSLVFIRECVKANIDVALRVIKPQLPINPGIVKVKTSLKTETALTFLANFITLTPGTLCVDINAEEGCFYVHWIDVKAQDAGKASGIIVRRFEKILKEVFE